MRFNLRFVVGDRLPALAALVVLLPVLAGCQASHRVVSYPPDTLPVEFEPATTYAGCLVASVVMAANYVEDRPRFNVKDVLAELKAAGADPTQVQVVKDYMAGKGLEVWTLAGGLDDKPPTGLGFWLRNQRYPVVCIVNRIGSSSDFNHAVVVIGFGDKQSVESADKIHYLDPSADRPLYACSAREFEVMWARCRNAMLVVTKRPGESAGTGAGDDGVSPR